MITTAFHLEGKVELLPQLSMEEIKKIKTLISEGDLKSAIKALIEYTENTPYHNQALQFNAMYKYYETERFKGATDDAELRRQFLELSNNILEYADILVESEKEKLPNDNEVEQKVREPKIRSLERKNIEKSPLSIVQEKKSIPSIKPEQQTFKPKKSTLLIIGLLIISVALGVVFLQPAPDENVEGKNSSEKINSIDFATIVYKGREWTTKDINKAFFDPSNQDIQDQFVNWKEAKAFCASLGIGWQLPDISDIEKLPKEFNTVKEKLQLTLNGWYDLEKGLLDTDKYVFYWTRSETEEGVWVFGKGTGLELVIEANPYLDRKLSCRCVKK